MAVMFGQREVLVVLAGVLLVHCEDPRVRVQQGLLRGKYIPSIEGNGTIVAFLGIPYAAPPVGDLRFKAPLPAHSWNGIRDATRTGAVCAQKNHLFHVKRGEEDCLFLNVYSPKLATKDDPLRPVMVWIHGGGFYFGSSSINIYGPEYLVHNGVVLVTLNYRVGPFGFLTLENSEVPGNAGLKDQVMALKWVQQNIEIFGGDPNNVTLFGQSAGGASVQYHMLSPMSKGLFHRAISQSGSTLHPWAFREPSKDYAFRVGKQLGMETNDSQELHQFLCSVPALTVTEAASKVLTPEEKPMEFEYAFLPTIDDKAEEPFLPSHPAKLLSLGQFHQVPYITGVNSQEGILALTKISENSDMFKRLENEFERVIPSDFPVTRNSSRSEEVVTKIKEFYFQGQPLSKKTMLPFINMVTDIWFHKDSAIAAEKIASHSSSPVYYYNFAFDGPFGILKKILGEKDIPGAAHADELGYLFTNFFNGRADLNSNKPHVVTLKRMVTMWTNFAHTGNPTPIADPLLNMTWISFTPQDSAYLNINNELSIEHGIGAERLQFWKQMYKTYA